MLAGGRWGVIRAVTARITQLSLLQCHLSWVGGEMRQEQVMVGKFWTLARNARPLGEPG